MKGCLLPKWALNIVPTVKLPDGVIPLCCEVSDVSFLSVILKFWSCAPSSGGTIVEAILKELENGADC